MCGTTMEARILTLEKQITRQRYLLAAIMFTLLVIGIGASLGRVSAVGEDVAEVVKAKAFVVVDDKGTVLAELTARLNAGLLATYTDKEIIQTVLGSGDEGGGYITCFNKKGEIQVNLGGDQDGGQVVVNAKTGMPRIVLSGDGDGGFVSAFSSEGTPRKLR